MAYDFHLYQTSFLYKKPKSYKKVGVFTITELFKKFKEENIKIPMTLPNFRSNLSNFFRDYQDVLESDEEAPCYHLFPKQGTNGIILGYSVTLPSCELKS